jgi:hypothetical protein
LGWFFSFQRRFPKKAANENNNQKSKISHRLLPK